MKKCTKIIFCWNLVGITIASNIPGLSYLASITAIFGQFNDFNYWIITVVISTNWQFHILGSKRGFVSFANENAISFSCKIVVFLVVSHFAIFLSWIYSIANPVKMLTKDVTCKRIPVRKSGRQLNLGTSSSVLESLPDFRIIGKNQKTLSWDGIPLSDDISASRRPPPGVFDL